MFALDVLVVDSTAGAVVSIDRAAVVGCGVIGAAWAARLVLHGVDVVISDPTPDASATFDAVLANAVAAYDELGLATDDRGTVCFASSVADAVADAEFVQESVPERIDVKVAVLAEIEAAVPADALIGSSTSGLLPTEMQANMAHPERLVVAHPYNPVYLLPVVEIVGGDQTSLGMIDRAKALYASIGMEPVHVRVEIDAFIGDRLLEAVWREALWLVADGVATTEEIDTVITHGFGLRWAQMGLFETYRVAGGIGGFRHFMSQFGPTLGLPWTKLMDTPEFTPELVDTIVEQSDAQSGTHTIRELERVRDANLVGFLKVLEANRWGAGRTVANHRGGRGGRGSESPS